jgi:hypothetical protein
MCRFMTSNDTSPNVEKKKYRNQPSRFIHPHIESVCLSGWNNARIVNEVKEDGFNS